MSSVQEHTDDDVQDAVAAWTMSHARNYHGMQRSGYLQDVVPACCK